MRVPPRTVTHPSARSAILYHGPGQGQTHVTEVAHVTEVVHVTAVAHATEVAHVGEVAQVAEVANVIEVAHATEVAQVTAVAPTVTGVVVHALVHVHVPVHVPGLSAFSLLPLLLSVLLFAPAGLHAQRPVTLRDAVSAALSSARMEVAAADSVVARAQLRTARAFPNPNLNLSWTTSTPTRHYELEQPLEYPWVRAARIRAAASGLSAAGYLLAAERAAVRFDVERAYAGAAAAREIRRLSERNVRDADELVRIAAARRSAGDASELDVELAGVTAGQARNTFLTDSLAEITGLLDLQTLMGVEGDRVTITLADSLDASPPPSPAVPPQPVRVLAAQAQLQQQQATAAETRLGRIPVPSIRGGWETGDESQPGRLPMFGFSLPIPLWNRSGGALAEANAAAKRARGALALAELETRAAVARTERERVLARDKVARDRTTVRDAERVAQLSMTAYHEGAYPLASVLEAQRNARDALRQFVQDLLEARTAEAAWVLARTAGADSGSAPAGAQAQTGSSQ